LTEKAARTKYDYCARLYHHGFGHVAICEGSACYFFARPGEVDESSIIFASSILLACIFQRRWLNNVREGCATMGFIGNLMNKLGLARPASERHPIRVLLLEDDERRCEWFAKRFKGDALDVAMDVERARELLTSERYDAIFLDHDLMPEHYNSSTLDDERTGYAIASFLASQPDLQRAATIMVHSYNADGGLRMVEELRRAGRQAEYVPFHFLEDRIRTFWPR